MSAIADRAIPPRPEGRGFSREDQVKNPPLITVLSQGDGLHPTSKMTYFGLPLQLKAQCVEEISSGTKNRIVVTDAMLNGGEAIISKHLSDPDIGLTFSDRDLARMVYQAMRALE